MGNVPDCPLAALRREFGLRDREITWPDPKQRMRRRYSEPVFGKLQTSFS